MKVIATSVAARKAALPAWSAARVQVPAVMKLATPVLALTVQTDGVLEE